MCNSKVIQVDGNVDSILPGALGTLEIKRKNINQAMNEPRYVTFFAVAQYSRCFGITVW